MCVHTCVCVCVCVCVHTCVCVCVCVSVEAAGGKALACVVDIRDEQQIGEAVQKAVDKFGGKKYSHIKTFQKRKND